MAIFNWQYYGTDNQSVNENISELNNKPYALYNYAAIQTINVKVGKNMRGIKFGLSDTSIQDSTDRVILPVMDGLAMAAFSTPGGTGKNYSQNRDGALKEHGTVTQNAYSKSFSSTADYIDTGLIDNSDFTALIVSGRRK
ncbi:hypothetical protein J4730_20875 [Klebsiella pneumoniae]|uniref:Uncharacterized protein n=1 Tax=Klebsiella pneumoniae TaxID=573 RepID=A0A939NIV3_KLEPN|nr:hypothetical protein [Klebsiella pneumoniae]